MADNPKSNNFLANLNLSKILSPFKSTKQLARSPIVVGAKNKPETSNPPKNLNSNLKIELAITQLATSIIWHEARQGFSKEIFDRWRLKHSEHMSTLETAFDCRFENIAETFVRYIDSFKLKENIPEKVRKLANIDPRLGSTWYSAELISRLINMDDEDETLNAATGQAVEESEEEETEIPATQKATLIGNATSVGLLSYDDFELRNDEETAGKSSNITIVQQQRSEPNEENAEESEEEFDEDEETAIEQTTFINNTKAGPSNGIDLVKAIVTSTAKKDTNIQKQVKINESEFENTDTDSEIETIILKASQGKAITQTPKQPAKTKTMPLPKPIIKQQKTVEKAKTTKPINPPKITQKSTIAAQEENTASEEEIEKVVVKQKKSTIRKEDRSNNSTLDLVNSIAQLLQITNQQDISINVLKSKSQDVDDWFKTYERLADANYWSLDKKGRKLSSFLRDKALEIWEEIPTKYRFDYQIVKEVLIKKLTPESVKTDAIEKFFNISQLRGESIEEYAARAKKLASKVDVLTEEEKAKRFVKGLRADIRLGMAIAKPKRLREAIKIAELVEKSLAETKELEINSVASGNSTQSNLSQPSEFICYNCRQAGHLARDCPYNVKNQGANRNHRGAYRSAHENHQHKFTNSPTQQPNTQSTSQNPYSNRNTNFRPFDSNNPNQTTQNSFPTYQQQSPRCYECGELGHLISNCEKRCQRLASRRSNTNQGN